MAVGNIPLYRGNEATDTADELACYQQRFALPTVDKRPVNGWYLHFDATKRLSLGQAGSKAVVNVDFVTGRLDYRRQKGGGELLVKAVHCKQHRRVIDATAGLGRDAFILAAHGCEVQLFERHPIVAALLYDGLQRALADEHCHDIARRMSLHHGSFLHAQPAVADVVYLDPMYPQRQKSAAVKKEMAYFHHLVGSDADSVQLLTHAAHYATKRVVVKRPRRGEYLAQRPADYQYCGQSTRFDVYIPSSLQDA